MAGRRPSPGGDSFATRPAPQFLWLESLSVRPTLQSASFSTCTRFEKKQAPPPMSASRDEVRRLRPASG